MKRLPLVAGLLLFSLAGCATLDQTDRYMLQEHHVPPGLYTRMNHGEPLSLTDVIELTQRHLSPGFIVHYLASTYAVYRLDERDVARLRQAQVSQQVIDYLLSTPGMYGPRYYPYPGPYYADPYPYGGAAIWVGPYRHRYWY